MNSTSIQAVADLEERLSEPSRGAIEAMGRLDGDLMLLGVGGKMGPSLARMAKRASDAAGKSRQVFGVSRFSDSSSADALRVSGVVPISCDLLEPEAVANLPSVPNIILMAGRKFGTTGQEHLTWATNTLLPANVCRRFATSRMVAFSTGNVYGMTHVATGGSVEADPLRPIGEYSMAAVARERTLEYFSHSLGTPMCLLRLNYATELRYGVLVDIARKVWSGEPIDVTMGYLNAIWQGDANAMALQCFDHVATPPRVLNLAGPEVLSVREVAGTFARLLQKPLSVTGVEATDAYLSNAKGAFDLFGLPRISAERLMEWIADWVRSGGPSLGKPTHFEVRDGQF
jgi:hypothetical protein